MSRDSAVVISVCKSCLINNGESLMLGIDKDIISAVFSLGLVLFFAVFVWGKLYFRAIKARKKALKELEEPAREQLPTVRESKVISKRTDIAYSENKKTPSHELKFYATFSFEGNSKEFEVSKETFERISVGESGNLFTHNGVFCDFK